MYISHPLSAYLPFGLLTLALISLWLRNNTQFLLRWLWSIVLLVAILIGLQLGQLTIAALLATALIATLAWAANRLRGQAAWQGLFGLAFALAALALGLHLVPGFHSLAIYHKAQLTADAIPYSLYLNFDKTLIALLVLGLWYQRPTQRLNWRQTTSLMLWAIPGITLVVVMLSLLSGYIHWEPKLITHLGIWAWSNLMFTCSAEESFFRGLIQHRLAEAMQNKPWGRGLALLIASLLFGLAHLAGGWSYALLAMVAGLGYGYLYQKSGRIEASILGHFSLNLVHILFFTYPALSA